MPTTAANPATFVADPANTLDFLRRLREVPFPHARAHILRARCRHDLALFARFYFPELTPLPFSRLHWRLFARRAEKTARPLATRRGAFDVTLAPRGAAKSTLLAVVFPLHAALYGLERYIVILSATKNQAVARLSAIRSRLAAAARLRHHFPRAASALAKSAEHSLILAGVRIDAAGAGAELRGLTHGAHRPSWIVLDDVEDSARVLASPYRVFLEQWIAEVVENLGDPATNIDLIGTLLHPDALPARLAARPGVRFATFRSILADSDFPELWDEWRARLTDPADPERNAAADRFFAQNHNRMLAGSRVLWPERESYLDLQFLRAAVGRRAFEKEKQNAPLLESIGLFSLSDLRRFDLTGPTTGPAAGSAAARLILDPPLTAAALKTPPEIPLNDLLIFGFLDPALGASRSIPHAASAHDAAPTGDCAAIATVGLDPTGMLYVLDLWVDRAPPSAQVARIFDLHQRWNYTLFGIEANAFQSLLLQPIEEERIRRRNARRPWQLPVRAVTHTSRKSARIATLEPLIANHWLSFARDLPRPALLQIEDYPNAPHDDVPDALAAAVALARAHHCRPRASDIATVSSRPHPRGF